MTKKPRNFYKSMKVNDWLGYGVQHGYNDMPNKEIAKLDKTYYLKGIKEGWLDKKNKPSGFFKNMSIDDWLDYGFDKGYDKMTRYDVSKKENAYYQKGLYSGWLDNLIPKPKRIKNGFYSKMDRDKWLTYGFRKEYDKLTRTGLADKNPRFYRVGLENGWLCGLISVSLQGSHFKK